MQQDILINWSPQETRVAIIENGSVQEIHMERTLERGLVGNIYLGKVARVLPGMQSAFVDIGLDRAAFLHVGDLLSSISLRHLDVNDASSQPEPIEKQIFEGQTLMVQVIKDPIGTKGARLTTQISLAGHMLVHLPQDNQIGISKKIPLQQRETLRARLIEALNTGPNQSDTGGFILRTNAEDASQIELSEDVAYLRKAWTRIKQASVNQAAKTVLHADLNLLQRVLRDLVGEHTQSIRIDSREQFALMQEFGQAFMPSAAVKLQHYGGERPIFDLFGIDEEITKALGRRVDLKSGGYLMIDQTEALTTVDVNTGGFVGAKNFDETIFKTNLEAAGAIARQLRLRNLGGIVVADFIDMVSDQHQAAVLQEFRKHLADDRVKTMVTGFSALGLVEMTRKRTRESLAHFLCEPCPTCQGLGKAKTARTLAYEILREILREARQFNPKEFKVIASNVVIDLLMDEEAVHLAALSEFIRKPISLVRDVAVGQTQYDIILL